MVDPLSLVGLIIQVVKQIASAAETASQNKHKCLELAKRAKNLAAVLPKFEHAAANDSATAGVLERLKDALGEALLLIQSCQHGRLLFAIHCSRKATKLDNVDKCINNCIMDLNLNSHSLYYEAQGGGAASSCVGHPPPQHATVNVQWFPGPDPYAASPAPSGSNLSSPYTFPTVKKVIKRVYDKFH
jgi:hypothetical protein